MMRMFPRFQPGNFEINMQLVQQVEAIAAKKGCTPAQSRHQLDAGTLTSSRYA